jgi:hypothetical protein
MDPNQAADLLGVRRDLLREKLRVAERRSELASIGFRSTLPDTTIGVLGNLSANQKVLLAMAEVAATYRLPAEDVRAATQRIAKCKTEAQQLAAVEHEAESLRAIAKSPKSGVVITAGTHVLRALRSLQNAMRDFSKLEQLQIVKDSDEHKRLRKEWAAIRLQANSIIGLG